MADITAYTTLTVNKDSLQLQRQATVTAAMSGSHFSIVAQTIATTDTQVTIGAGVATGGYTYFRNLSDTHFVRIGVHDVAGPNFLPLIKLMPGEVALIRLATTTVWAKADTASVVLESCVVEE